MTDYLFRGDLADLDPSVYELTQLEGERQYRKLILIPSETMAPLAVRQALGSQFQNLYAEGYPEEDTRSFTEQEVLDYEKQLGFFRRYSDPRYYKGVEYADIVEELARRRCAELFATNGYAADDIFVNVQPLSGAPANNAVYTALINPGDTILGMSLLHGGHLTHGSSVNRSGKFFNATHYTVDPDTEQINYDAVMALAQQHKPKIIIAGYSSYPWSVDWKRFREIADTVGAVLLADIAHVAGLVVAGVYPSPVGYAHVITFTTHKSLCGPRGACILTTDSALARKLDKAVFPGEQGGPHVHAIAGMAVAFKLDKSDQFRQLGIQIVKNCAAFTARLKERGFRIPYGGTDTHMMNLDCHSVKAADGTPLSGDMAARILDLAGIVVNRNTIPGDKSATSASGIRMGSPWVTQRGFKEAEMIQAADIIADVLQSATPYIQEERRGEPLRAKVDFKTLEDAKMRTRQLAEAAGVDYSPARHGYPHYYFIDDAPEAGIKEVTLEVEGERAHEFLNYAVGSDVDALMPGVSQATCLYTNQGEVDGKLSCASASLYRLTVPAAKSGLAAAWLRDLADGFVVFDDDPLRKLPGPVGVRRVQVLDGSAAVGEALSASKPYFICAPSIAEHPALLPAFAWVDQEGPLRRTPVYETHRTLGAKIIPFAGWEMPVWYSSVVEEHLAVRQAAGLFDVAHMGVYQAEGPDAAAFLDSVVGNDAGGLGVGESLYTHLLTPQAEVLDDLLVYRRGPEKFLVVVNASNDDKDWAWLNAVKEGKVMVDPGHPGALAYGRNVTLRNLRDPKEGADMRVDIALQGPKSRDILLALGADDATRKRIMALKRTELCDAVVGSFDLVVSRTGYTGEKMAFELFVHPNRADEFFNALLKVGEPFGLKPCGLGARDSLRTEAGLPLYGHEMGVGSGKLAGPDLGVAEGGFGTYVKARKPWFIGREAFLRREKTRKGVVARFRFTEKGVRMAHNGDPVVDKRGRAVGYVTSCAIDSEGFLTGQAFVDLKTAEEGTSIFIYQSAPKEAGKAPAELRVGDRSNLPTQAVIVSRFPK
jgi:glycine hydroxymethyltransferase